MRRIGLALAGVLLIACASQPERRKSRHPRPGAPPGDPTTATPSTWPPSLAMQGRLPEGAGGSSEGKASYYSRRFIGRKTASGEPYDPHKYTAAHKTLPMGTVVRVTRLPNGPHIQVRINDRCGCTNGRQIDLSEAAARHLDMLREGVIPVRIDVMGR